MEPVSNGPLILGGTGHVGRALNAVWPSDAPATWQSRQDGPFAWDMLNEAPPKVPAGTTGIIALAGVTSGDQLDQNTSLALAACALGQRENLPVLLASSQAVYGAHRGIAHEDDTCQPANPYGQSKLAMEQAVAHYDNVTSLRISNVIGCDMLLRNAALGREMKLDQFPDGNGPTRSYISAVVLGAVLRKLLALDTALPKVLNVSQDGSIAMADLLKAAGISWEWVPAGPNALASLDLDTSTLTSLLPVPVATPAQLIADARAAGWRPA